MTATPTVTYKDQIFELCPIGHVIQTGNLIVRFLNESPNIYPVERIGGRYAIVRVNPFTTDRFPLIYTDDFKPYNVDKSTIKTAVYQIKN